MQYAAFYNIKYSQQDFNKTWLPIDIAEFWCKLYLENN